jgi:hypothetical protein
MSILLPQANDGDLFMMKFKTVSVSSAGAAIACSLWLAGCATQPESTPAPVTHSVSATPIPTPTPTPTVVAPTPAIPVVTETSVLKEGIAQYNNGDFNGAIKRLSSANEIWGPGGSKAVQLDALKYLAFSYCVTGRQVLCRAQFEKALKLDPAFDLAPGEKGHPLWGPAFVKAQKANKKSGK